MTNQTAFDWNTAAAAFDIPDHEIPHFREAFEDVIADGMATYADKLLADLNRFKKDGGTPEQLRVLEIRRIVLVEAFGFNLGESTLASMPTRGVN